jgi:hypothetical protein
LERAGCLGADAADAEFHFGTPFAVPGCHQFIRRSAFNLTVDRPLARHWKLAVLRAELVRIGEPPNDLKVDLWNSLPFHRHIQLGNDLIDYRLDLWN